MSNEKIKEIIDLHPDYDPAWVEYAFLRWCHPLGGLAWKVAHEKAIAKHGHWIGWLQGGCLHLIQKEESFIDFAKKELEDFLKGEQIGR